MPDDYEPSDADAPAEDGHGGRVPPHDLLAEQSTVGGMMLSRDAIPDVLEVLKPSDFYIPKHEVIAQTIAALYAKGDPTDVLAVTAELQRTGKTMTAGGLEYVHQLTGVTPTGANAGYYAQRVAELALHRALVAAGTRIIQMGYASEGEPDELLDQARAEVDSASSAKKRTVRMIGATFDDLINSLDEKPEYSPTPWASIDKMIGGFAAGSMYVIAARPGEGKTIALLQSATALAKRGMVAFCSLEMTEAELQTRLLAQFGDVHMQSLRNHDLSPIQWNYIRDARAAVQQAPIFVDDSAAATVTQIRAHARAVARKGPLSAICVDYLQLVDSEGESRRVVVDNVSRQMKQLAKEFGVPVLAAAQLNRVEKQRGGRPLPTLQNLREAGGIEQNADVVMLLHHDQEKKPRDLTVVIAKNRHGEQGRVTLHWQAEYARLRDKAWSPTSLLDDMESE